MVFDFFPAYYQPISRRLLKRSFELHGTAAWRAEKYRDCLSDSSFEQFFLALFYVDRRNLKDHLPRSSLKVLSLDDRRMLVIDPAGFAS